MTALAWIVLVASISVPALIGLALAAPAFDTRPASILQFAGLVAVLLAVLAACAFGMTWAREVLGFSDA